MFGFLKRRRRQRVLREARLDEANWQRALGEFSFTRVLDAASRRRLKDLVILFLAEKPIHGAAGLTPDDSVRLSVAIQACMLILNLDLDWYRPWTEVIVYPGGFVAKREQVDAAGVVHTYEQPLSGESWGSGTVVLSWADAQRAGKGEACNVVIHEFAHQLDMLNGDADGFPPLHRDMSRRAWTRAFKAAYEDLCRRVDAWQDTLVDGGATESPGEFFAYISEAFIEIPQAVRDTYPDVYAQLAQFYRQDPAARMARTVSPHADASAAST